MTTIFVHKGESLQDAIDRTNGGNEIHEAIKSLRAFCANTCKLRLTTPGSSNQTCGEEMSCKIGKIIAQLQSEVRLHRREGK